MFFVLHEGTRSERKHELRGLRKNLGGSCGPSVLFRPQFLFSFHRLTILPGDCLYYNKSPLRSRAMLVHGNIRRGFLPVRVLTRPAAAVGQVPYLCYLLAGESVMSDEVFPQSSVDIPSPAFAAAGTFLVGVFHREIPRFLLLRR